jgi:hypothetical protein
MTKFENFRGILTGEDLARKQPEPIINRMTNGGGSGYRTVILHLLAYEDGTDGVFRNVGI